jgi:hypothetical protein
MAFAEIAIASSTVDLPEPFSPTRIVTGAVSGTASTPRSAGRSNGNPVASRSRAADRLTDRRWITTRW